MEETPPNAEVVQEPSEAKRKADDAGHDQARTAKRPKFIYGNYDRYYGYRAEQDSRLRVFKQHWFQSKKCFDIGCNIGKLTMDVAARFKPSKMVGVDIDASLIGTASKAAAAKVAKLDAQIRRFPKSLPLLYGPLRGAAPTEFPRNVSFVAGNVLEMSDDEQQYDTIMCLSTTKWIHLNWGDEGIKKLFQLVHDRLVPGGLFVLEPQEFKTYKKKNTLSQDIKQQFKSIVLKPEQFVDYLAEHHSFELVEKLNPPAPEAGSKVSKGFDRPIYLLRKAGGTPTQPTDAVTSQQPSDSALEAPPQSDTRQPTAAPASAAHQPTALPDAAHASIAGPRAPIIPPVGAKVSPSPIPLAGPPVSVSAGLSARLPASAAAAPADAAPSAGATSPPTAPAADVAAASETPAACHESTTAVAESSSVVLAASTVAPDIASTADSSLCADSSKH
eukprot:TRINITY_DN2126_c0_g1_i2.p1 TRINITY_DN2126_c0_g1~~TRINITY_DN2126_c0_g1_i2.p1  ORF type:complete len:445 (-),score=134.32 TRINITY_DN2126_c0_g1_i2:146-1480(-)